MVAVSGYDPGDRLDGWYDALLATVSAGAPRHRRPPRVRCPTCLTGLPDTGVPHDGPERAAPVAGRLAGGTTAAPRELRLGPPCLDDPAG